MILFDDVFSAADISDGAKYSSRATAHICHCTSFVEAVVFGIKGHCDAIYA
jgi:hypothetical protein